MRLDSAVGAMVGLAAQFMTAVAIFVALGQLSGANLVTRLATALAPFLTYPIAVGIRVFTVPRAMAREATEKAEAEAQNRRDAEAAAAAQLAALAAEVEALKNPLRPARDPDGIYQHDRQVGVVVGAMVDLSQSVARFAILRGAADFDLSREFEYRDLLLNLKHADTQARSVNMGQVTQMATNAICAVVRVL